MTQIKREMLCVGFFFLYLDNGVLRTMDYTGLI